MAYVAIFSNPHITFRLKYKLAKEISRYQDQVPHAIRENAAGMSSTKNRED